MTAGAPDGAPDGRGARGGGSGDGRPPAAPSSWRGALLPLALLAGLAAFVGAELRGAGLGAAGTGAGSATSGGGAARDAVSEDALSDDARSGGAPSGRAPARAHAPARGVPPHIHDATTAAADHHPSTADRTARAHDRAASTHDRAARTRALLRRDAAGTYVHALLGADTLVVRWPLAAGRAIPVWVQPRTAVRDWYPWHLGAARQAFRDWARVVPVAFAFTNDSAAAAVHLLWVDRLPADDQIGRNRLTYQAGGAVVAAQLTLAVHDGRGRPLPPDGVRQVALHEIGHALGLPHSPHPGDVMAARWDGRAPALSPADVATARLLYALPVGGVGGGGEGRGTRDEGRASGGP